MESIEFRKKYVTARIRNPLKDFQITEEQIEVRSDPLTGENARITKPKGLDRIPEGEPLYEFVSQSKPCFFCREKVDTHTPMLPPEIEPLGRIRIADALLFPNLSGFGKYSGVCIFSKDHFISIEEFTTEQILNTLKACQIYFQKCAMADKEMLYPSVNGNYLLPAGSSILHPHLQPFMDPLPTTYHQNVLNANRVYWLQFRRNYWDDLKELEKSGERFLFGSTQCFFHTPFAPSGFNQIDGIIGNGASFLEFEDETLTELAEATRTIFRFYHKIRHNSFNLALFSPPVRGLAADHDPAAAGSTDELVNDPNSNISIPCLLKICTRPAFTPNYRNDVTFFEKFHGEAMIDKTPEQTAAEFRQLMKVKG